MGIKQEVDFADLADAVNKLNEIKLRAEDISQASDGIRLILQQDVDYRFQTAPNTQSGGTVYGGVNWNSLSESYMATNPRRYNGQILRDTGELQQSLTNEASPYNIYDVGESYLVFGSSLPKAGRLQKNRPFVFFHPELTEKIAAFLVNYLGGI